METFSHKEYHLTSNRLIKYLIQGSKCVAVSECKSKESGIIPTCNENEKLTEKKKHLHSSEKYSSSKLKKISLTLTMEFKERNNIIKSFFHLKL